MWNYGIAISGIIGKPDPTFTKSIEIEMLTHFSEELIAIKVWVGKFSK